MSETSEGWNGEELQELSPHRVLDTSNRRSAGIVYLVAAIVGAILVLSTDMNAMWLTTVLPLLIIGFYHILAGRGLGVTDREAIATAMNAAPFDAGHSSATLGFDGPLARPIWQVLVFGSGTTPRNQALITIDGETGAVTGVHSEEVEDV